MKKKLINSRSSFISNKKKGDINYFLGILIVAVIGLAILAIANNPGTGWASSISTAIKNIIDKAIASVANATNFN